MSYGVRDANLSVSRALPNGAAGVTSTAINLKKGGTDDFVAPCDVLIEAPALTTSELADSATVKYDVIHSDNADLSSPVTLCSTVLTQTGAGGAGAAAASARLGLPSNVKQFIGLKATNSGAGNQTGKSAALSLVF
jgi:hypothetical protein